MSVVPLVGTWIEIFIIKESELTAEVVPLVGTWIEIYEMKNYSPEMKVVPLVGTWIEIHITRMGTAVSAGRSPRGNVD